MTQYLGKKQEAGRKKQQINSLYPQSITVIGEVTDTKFELKLIHGISLGGDALKITTHGGNKGYKTKR